MTAETDVVVIGAGPAGTSSAIFLAQAGWRVALMEQQPYPKQKVCGECIGAGHLETLDRLGVGAEFRQRAGPELRTVGWMSTDTAVVADMPACTAGPYRYGRAVGRDILDGLLLQRARSLGVEVIQPARMLKISGSPGRFACEYEMLAPGGDTGISPQILHVPIVIDAHGCWERGPTLAVGGLSEQRRPPRRTGELLAFKASFQDSSLPEGFLPVIALAGGYGGMVVAEKGRTTVACCIRRDALEACRRHAPGESAGVAVEAYLRRSCRGLAEVLEGAHRIGSWMSVGLVRPGVRVDSRNDGILRVGNAAGETHPLVGEGIGMALQSAGLLARHLAHPAARAGGPRWLLTAQRSYASAWRREFAPRIRLSGLCANIAMNPTLAALAGATLRHTPSLLTRMALMVGKGRYSSHQSSFVGELA